MKRRRGIVLILVILLAMGLMVLAVMSVQLSKVLSVVQDTQRGNFLVRQISESAVAHAISRIKECGMLAPISGSGTTAQWVNFSGGQYYYYTTYDAVAGLSTIRAWGRLAAQPSPSPCNDAPDSGSWNGTGWILHGIEVTVRSGRYVPEFPLYFGNGGIEKPKGGFEWGAGVNPSDPSTWIPVTIPSSTQASTVPFKSSALDYPIDYLYNGGSPAPSPGYPHPYKIWAAQNKIGQYDIEAWFKNSAGATADPTVGLTPPPTASYYDVANKDSQNYPYPVIPDIPDVQNFAFELWSRYKDDPATIKLASGSQSGTYGTLASPKIAFVTGQLNVASTSTFQGCGILVIRDNYDPNTQTNNTPTTRAQLSISGKFKWTGLVIIAGWAPDISVGSNIEADATIVGSLFGEDSVQSGGEVSLDSATIQLVINGPFRILYSNALFRPGGLLYDYLPLVMKSIIAVREI